MSFPLEQVNLFCLSKQHLTTWSLDADVRQVARDITYLQAPSAITPFLSLWARMRRFSPQALMRELYQERQLVKAKCMRGDIVILPVYLAGPAIVATREQCHGNDLARTYHIMARMTQKARGETNTFEVSDAELEELRARIVRILSHECLTIEQLKKRLATHVNVSYIVYALCDASILIRGPTVRWDNSKHHYTAWENWLPGVTLDTSPDEARAILIKAYIRSYEPVCLEDVIWWTGFTKQDTSKVIKDLGADLTEIRIDCFEGRHLISKDGLNRLKSVKYLDEPVVNLLPSQDNYVVAYRRRSRHSVRDIYPRIHDRAGNVLPVILIDGQVQGVWDIVDNRVQYTLFEKTDASTAYEVNQKARSLEQFLRDNL